MFTIDTYVTKAGYEVRLFACGYQVNEVNRMLKALIVVQETGKQDTIKIRHYTSLMQRPAMVDIVGLDFKSIYDYCDTWVARAREHDNS